MCKPAKVKPSLELFCTSPLSLWNPLDYLRLLYWVFYFPQALRWYLDTFGSGYIPANTLPEAERSLIVDIAQTWQKALLEVAGEVGEIAITKPVSNPYVVGDPVEGNLFVGREEVRRQLEELWIMGHQLQSTVLYGHRRMDKTSILKNATNSLGLNLGEVQGDVDSLKILRHSHIALHSSAGLIAKVF